MCLPQHTRLEQAEQVHHPISGRVAVEGEKTKVTRYISNRHSSKNKNRHSLQSTHAWTNCIREKRSVLMCVCACSERGFTGGQEECGGTKAWSSSTCSKTNGGWDLFHYFALHISSLIPWEFKGTLVIGIPKIRNQRSDASDAHRASQFTHDALGCA